MDRSKPQKLDVSVRELTEADLGNGFLDALAALSEVKLTAEQAKSVYAELAPNLRTYVAVLDGRVVGTTRLLVERKFIHGGGLVGHVEDVAVAPPYQHRGVGSALVRHVVAEARRLGCYKVILDCFDDLATFYARMGFRPFNRGLRLDLAPPNVVS
jgi:glucosamine-phosphate N-acetyltransferase